MLAAVIAAAGVILHPAASPPDAHAALTFTVDNDGDASDSAPGDGSCKTAGNVCTLRAAIEEANAYPGADTIEFALGGPYPVIKPSSTLPVLATDIHVKGATGGATRVEISGINAGITDNGLNIITTGGAVTVESLAIHSFDNRGICIVPGGTVTIRASHVGLDGPGGAAGNTHGIEVNTCSGGPAGSGTVVIGGPAPADRNVISANAVSGISSTGPLALTSLVIQGNYVGTDPSGTVGLGNGTGIGAFNAIIEDNLVSGNTGTGISAGKSTVKGNLVGTNAAGTAPIPNGAGLVITAPSNVIGGFAIGDPNVISGNATYGVRLHNALSANNQLIGNYIGVRSDGTTALPNGSDGVLIEDGAEKNLILVNAIKHNGGAGVRMPATAGASNDVSANQVYANGGLGIDLGAAGITANDALDADTGPNNLMNFPVLTAAVSGLGQTAIVGTLSTAANRTLSIDFFSSPTCDASGSGEGAVYLGYIFAASDGSGSTGQFGFLAPSVTVGHVVTAVARDSTVGGGDTSEFSPCFAVAACDVADLDCDAFKDTAPSDHAGPQNKLTSFDNCPGTANPSQNNNDGNYTDLSPPKAFDDLTAPMSDGKGDACDPDDDNDALTDVDEPTGANCGGKISNPLKQDTDGDHFLDGAECALGSDPGNMGLKPTLASCGASGDADADGVLTQREVCFFNTDPNFFPNTDGDACREAREIASINLDTTVNVLDLSQIAGEFGVYVLPGNAVKRNYDVNKDAAINVLDLSFVAGQSGACP